MDSPLGNWVYAVLKQKNAKVVRVRMMGGSLPTQQLVSALQVPFVIVPLVNADNNQHSFDENLRIGHYIDGMKTLLALMHAQGEVARLFHGSFHGGLAKNPLDMLGQAMVFRRIAPQVGDGPDGTVRNASGQARLITTRARSVIPSQTGARHSDALAWGVDHPLVDGRSQVLG